jgi:hypothetical protein
MGGPHRGVAGDRARAAHWRRGPHAGPCAVRPGGAGAGPARPVRASDQRLAGGGSGRRPARLAAAAWDAGLPHSGHTQRHDLPPPALGAFSEPRGGPGVRPLPVRFDRRLARPGSRRRARGLRACRARRPDRRGIVAPAGAALPAGARERLRGALDARRGARRYCRAAGHAARLRSGPRRPRRNRARHGRARSGGGSGVRPCRARLRQGHQRDGRRPRGGRRDVQPGARALPVRRRRPARALRRGARGALYAAGAPRVAGRHAPNARPAGLRLRGHRGAGGALPGSSRGRPGPEARQR